VCNRFMPARSRRRPRDLNALAAQMVGQPSDDEKPQVPEKARLAVELPFLRSSAGPQSPS
jgi:hypothetical protein